MAHWVMQRDALALMIPSPDGTTRRAGSTVDGRRLRARARRAAADGRVRRLPRDLRREARSSRNGTATAIRDDYEIALLRAFVADGKPVLGVCRGAQMINVAHGRHAVPGHRDAACRARSTIATGTSTTRTSTRPRSCRAPASPRCIRDATLTKTNSVHHQAVKDLGRDLVVEAWSEPDRIVEALRWHGSVVRVRRAVASGVPRSGRRVARSTTRRSSTTSCAARQARFAI